MKNFKSLRLLLMLIVAVELAVLSGCSSAVCPKAQSGADQSNHQRFQR